VEAGRAALRTSGRLGYDLSVQFSKLSDQNPIARLNIQSLEKHYGHGASMMPHYHDEACLVLILSGFAAHTEGHQSVELHPGSALYLPPAQRHSDVFGPHGAHCVVNKIDPLWIHRLGSDFGGLTPRVTRDGHLYALGVAIHQEIKKPDDLSELIVEGSLLELFGRWKRDRRRRAQCVPGWLEQAKSMLVDSFSESISLQDLSRSVGVHPVRIAREFRRFYGVTAGAYIRKLRIDFVVERLSAPGKMTYSTLTDLALDAGFSSHAHMAFAFKRITGFTPSEFRKLHGPHRRDESR
jgi:AraC family transcriptional regulator